MRSSLFVFLRVLGILLMLFSISFILAALVGWYFSEHAMIILFIKTTAFTALIGFLFWLIGRQSAHTLRPAQSFLMVVLSWLTLCCAAMMPFKLYGVSWINALFEGVSGLTTTGAEALKHLSDLPHAIVFYHQWLEFIGGLGIIILAMALLPLLGVGGLQLYRTEAPGPLKEGFLALKITETVKKLWFIYLALTLLIMAAYRFFGMTSFEAICEGLSTVSTGGFSIYDDNFGHYHQKSIHLVAMIAMLLSAMKYGLHYLCLKEKTLRYWYEDKECKTFMAILLSLMALVSITLIYYNSSSHWSQFIQQGWFASISMLTTTGYTTGDYAQWPSYLPFILMLVTIIGGCSGSTSGGIKVMRFALIHQEAHRALKQLIHPEAVFSIHFGQPVSERILQSIRGFIALFTLVYIIILAALLAGGLSLEDAFAAATASLTNTGASIAGLSKGYAHLSLYNKSILIFAMLAGRLEIMTLFVLFLPSYWRRF
jgi:trk system potassium uptake protein